MNVNDQISPGSFKKIQVWSEGETKQMLDQYTAYLEEIGPLKKFRNKKEMWSQIANDVVTKTAKQCEERFKTVMRRKKAAIDNNSASGSKRQNVDFEQELEKICSVDDSLDPEVRISSHHIEKKKKVVSPPRKKSKPATSTLQQAQLDFLKTREDNKERRHAEKMQRADKLHDLLQKIAEKEK